MIGLEQLSVGYAHRTLLEPTTCHFEAGTLTALIGRNGAGKSTLLRVLAGAQKPLAGRVLIGGEDIAMMPPETAATAVSIVTTERVRVPSLTVTAVVALGRAPYTDWIGRLAPDDCTAVRDALQAVGMEEYADRSMDSLSDGESQRVMIARALAQQTAAILLDEPTAFLDVPGRYGVCDLLRSLAHDSGKCILFSTHDLDSALRSCDALAVMNAQTLHTIGTADFIAERYMEKIFGIK